MVLTGFCYLLFSSRACRADPFLRFHSGWTCNQRRRPGTPGWSTTMETEEGTLQKNMQIVVNLSYFQIVCLCVCVWVCVCVGVCVCVTNLTLVPAGCRSVCSDRGSTHLHRPDTLPPSWTPSIQNPIDRTETLQREQINTEPDWLDTYIYIYDSWNNH